MPVTDGTMILFAVIVAVILLSLVVLGLALRDTIRGKGRWGINFNGAFCQKCGEPAPLVRTPKSLNQTLWGGWTCFECGFELDKWGEPVPNQLDPAKWKLLDAVERERRSRRAAAKRQGEDRIQGGTP